MPTKRLSVTLLGGGVMGRQIAVSLAAGGIQCHVWIRRPGAVTETRRLIEHDFRWMVEHHVMPMERLAGAQRLLHSDSELESCVSKADVVIEAVPEVISTKHEVLRTVERLVQPTTILASTTSGISPSIIAQCLDIPERFIVTHYAQPAHLIEIVEVVLGEETSEQTAQAVEKLLSRTGKLPLRIGDVPGFLFARLQYAILRELIDLVDRGIVTAAACDELMKRGYAGRLTAMGPFEHVDLIGTDFAARLANTIWPSLSDRTSIIGSSLERLVATGNLGVKSGQGYHDWQADPQGQQLTERRDEAVAYHLRRSASPSTSQHAATATSDGGTAVAPADASGFIPDA